MINLFILMILVINLAIFFCKNNEDEFGKYLFFSFLLILLSNYVISIFNALNIICIIYYLFSMMILIKNIIFLKKNKILIKKYFKSSVFFYLIFIALFSIIIFDKFYISGWDEFTQWGLYVKNIFINNKIWRNNFTSCLNGYPPIVSLFQAVVMKFNNKYSESLLFSSLFLLNTFPFILIVERIKQKKWYFKILIIFFSILLPFAFFGDYFNSIYLDITLGAYFGVILYYFVFEKNSIFKFLFLNLMLSFLVLTKEFGIVLVGIFYLLLFIDILFLRRDSYKEFYKKICNKKRNVIILILIFLLPIIFRGSWWIYVKYVIAATSQLSTISSATLIPSYALSLSRTYLYNLYALPIATPGGIVILSAGYFAVFALLLLLLLKYAMNEKKYNNKFKLAFWIILCSFIIYSLGLLLSYIFIFSEEEALRFASYGRYILSILLSIFIFIYFFIIDLYINKKNKRVFHVLVIIIIFVTMCFGISPIKQLKNNMSKNNLEKNKISFYESYNNIYELGKYLKKSDSIYFISMGDNGLRFWISKYILTPIRTQFDGYWSIGSPVDDNDIWTKNLSIKSFTKRIKNMKYIYIDNINKNFKDKYGSLFESKSSIDNECLYTIKNTKNKKLIIYKKKCFND